MWRLNVECVSNNTRKNKPDMQEVTIKVRTRSDLNFTFTSAAGRYVLGHNSLPLKSLSQSNKRYEGDNLPPTRPL